MTILMNYNAPVVLNQFDCDGTTLNQADAHVTFGDLLLVKRIQMICSRFVDLAEV